MTLKPGDIVRWKAGHGSRYTPGPYRVITVNLGVVRDSIRAAGVPAESDASPRRAKDADSK